MKSNPNRSHTGRPIQQKGFTLVEMLLVLTILAILAGIVYPRLSKHTVTARVSATKAQLKAFDTALQLFEMDNGRVPGGRNGLLELVVKPTGAANWHGPYLDNIPKDPWGNDYVYVYPGKHRVDSFDLSSAGPDGQMGTDDDINNWPAPQAAR